MTREQQAQATLARRTGFERMLALREQARAADLRHRVHVRTPESVELLRVIANYEEVSR